MVTSSNFQIGAFDGSGTRDLHSVVKFDVSSLSNVTVQSAKLNLEIRSSTNTPVPIQVHRLTTDWSESTVTWNSPWSASGGDYSGNVEGSSTFDFDITLGHPTETMHFDITDLVNGWVQGSYPNYGLVLLDPTGANESLNVYSSEGVTVPTLDVVTSNGSSVSTSTTFRQTIPMCTDLDMPVGGVVSANVYVNSSGSMPSNPDVEAVLKHDNTTFATLTNPVLIGGPTNYGISIAATGGSPSFVNDMLGAPDGVGGQIYNDNDFVVIELSQELSIGTNYDILIRQACVGSTSYFQIDESSDNSTFYTNSASPGSEVSALFQTHSFTAENPTRYIKIIKTTGACIQVDAVTYVTDQRLEWSTTLGSSYTLPAGDTISIEITNNESNANFTIEFDSETKPSRIDLPTETVIEHVSLDVHDLSYSGNEIITGSYNGDTVYIRAEVSDPFGFEDITSQDLTITDPANNVSVITALPVDSTGCTRTYEYCWVTPGLAGDYTIQSIVHEGYEGAIADTAITVFNISFNDFGSDCILSFTNTSGDPVSSFSADEQVCLHLNEADKNANPLVAETVNVTLTSLDGDTETVTLTETGIHTGIFTGCINSSSTIVGSSENGTLYATTGGGISATYIDPNNIEDICQINGLISLPNPDILITKERILPSDGIALIGEFIQFDIIVSNTGPTEITSATLSDTYNTCMTFDSASITPTSSGGGSISWSNIGPIISGQSVTISTYFTAASTCDPAINTASVSGTDENSAAVSDGPVNAQVVITDPVLAVTKTLLSPVGTAYMGDILSYQITIQNNGTTDITTLPLSDFYSSSCLEYVSSSVVPDATGGGILLWNNLGTLNSSAQTSLTVDMRVIGPCTPILNVADVSYAIDENGDEVPPDNDSAIKYVQLPPVAVDDVETTTENTPVVINVPQNDSDPNDDLNLGSVGMTGLLQPSDGVINNINGSTGEITYTPNNGFTGVDQFEYYICDLSNPTVLCDTALVTVYVQCPGIGGQINVTGNYFNDSDMDGFYEGSDFGQDGVKIYLYQDINQNGSIEGLDILLDSVISSGGGLYSFTPVAGFFPCAIYHQDGHHYTSNRCCSYY